jgi:hypothetical protein
VIFVERISSAISGLTSVGTAVSACGPWSAVVAFGLYGIGMATTLGVLTLVAGIVSFGVLVRARALGRFVSVTWLNSPSRIRRLYRLLRADRRRFLLA